MPAARLPFAGPVHETQATVAADGSLVLAQPASPPLQPGQTVSVKISPVAVDNARADGPGAPAVESVTLGLGSQFRLVEEGDRPESGPGPCGHLPTPPAVEELLAAQAERLAAMSSKARQRFIDDHNLSYSFGGQEVAFRFADRGVEVLAVGRREIERLKEALPPAELVGLVEERVRPW
jgi:hypothetical protein